MDYKVCILAAGVGTRVGSLTDNISKAILPVNQKAVISYIIEKFPPSVEIVIAVGHQKESVIDYLAVAHPERKFTFVHVERYIGPGTGPGYSLLKCKEQLQCPFVFTTADTIVLEDVPPPDKNWYGIAPVKDTEQYCTVEIKNNLVYTLADKVKCNNRFAFIGLAGIYDYTTFFDSLEHNTDQIKGEIQVSNGFRSLIEKKLFPVGFTWFDTGSVKGYKETCRAFEKYEGAFNFSKTKETLYFVNDRVIKYFDDEEITKRRVERARYLSGLCPDILLRQGKFYAYRKIPGHILYDVLNTRIMDDFLQWASRNLWKPIQLPPELRERFAGAARRFYYDKTLERLSEFTKKTGIEDSWHTINGMNVPPLSQILSRIDWKMLTDAVPVLFHGDLQFDNVLVVEGTSNPPAFVLLDWRHDFGGMVEAGDLYYDYAKLYGGILLPYNIIKQNQFRFDLSGKNAFYGYTTKSDLIDAKEEFEQFLRNRGASVVKVKLLTALIFLNMSPLHHDPFNHLLYFMGKRMLFQTLQHIGGHDAHF